MQLPKVITFEVTQRCNCCCEMCRFWSNDTACADTRDLSFSKIKKIILNIKKIYNVKNQKLFFGITGGEPFLRKDLLDIFKFFKNNDIDYDIITNFSIPNKEVIKKLSNYPPERLNISLDGIGKTHDLIRGQKIFSKIVKNIGYFRYYCPQVPIKVNSTINKRNVLELDKMAKFAIKNKLELNFQHLNFVTPRILEKQKRFEIKNLGKSFFHEPTFYTLTKDEVADLRIGTEKAELVAKKNSYHISFLPNIRESVSNWYLRPELRIINAKCDINRLRIKPDGELVHCERFSYGNLLKSDFENILESKNAKKFKKVISSKIMPFCSRCCLRFRKYTENKN